ncbi:MAG: squalene synthase HpnC [Casimicrobiaceae bacterium]
MSPVTPRVQSSAPAFGPPTAPVSARSSAIGVDGHYENFPVASWLIPRAQRPFIHVVYRFARHADDLADEGNMLDADRLAALAALGAEVEQLWAGYPPQALMAPTVRGLAPIHAGCPQIGAEPFLALLSAFAQDVHKKRYADSAELLDYCSRSANPVGRIILRLFGLATPEADAESDAICTSLQLINFWQDAAIDARRGRVYVPLDALERFGLDPDRFPFEGDHRALMQAQCAWALRLMRDGSALLSRLRGRLRWEIALTIAGGVRILERIAARGYDVRERPVLGWYDLPIIVRRAMAVMRRGASALRLDRGA